MYSALVVMCILGGGGVALCRSRKCNCYYNSPRLITLCIVAAAVCMCILSYLT